MMHQMIIRPFQGRDATAVRSIFIRVNQELAPTELYDEFEKYIALSLKEEICRIPEYYGSGPGRGFWVVEGMPHGAIVGFFGLEPAGNGVAELRRMYVSPEMRRRGLARSMLAEAEHQCRSAGLRRLVLSTSELQQAALSLYRGAGYQLLKEETAETINNKTVGAGIRRFHMEKCIS